MATATKARSAGAKSVMRRLRESSPDLLIKNRVYYEVQRARAYKDVRLRPELTERRDLLEGLARDGIVVVPSYWPADEVKAMLAASEEVLAEAKEGRLEGRTYAVQPDIVCRVKRPEELIGELAPFFESTEIRSLVAAYLSPRAAPFRHELEYRFGLAKQAQADLFHFDNWKPICKAFLYLDDVGEDNAPFVYLPGSHHLGAWRRRQALEFDAYGPSGPFGHFFPQEIRALKERFGWEEKVCTGPAGTLILADLRGLHRGTPLRAGRRVLLNNTFDLMNARRNSG